MLFHKVNFELTPHLFNALSNLRPKGSNPRYSTKDHWIQESIKRIFNSGLFWAVRAAEKKNPNCHVCYFWAFLCFHGQNKFKMFFWRWKHKKMTSKVAHFWPVRFLFYSAASTTQNSPELNIRFIDSCIQWSVVL